MENIKFSKNKKLNAALTAIYEDLKDFGEEEIKHYKKQFNNEVDFNIVQYGNLLCYYDDVYKFYEACGYKSLSKLNNQKIWDIYKRQVGYIARFYF